MAEFCTDCKSESLQGEISREQPEGTVAVQGQELNRTDSEEQSIEHIPSKTTIF